MVKSRRIVNIPDYSARRSISSGVVGSTQTKRRISSTMPWSVLIWSLVLFHTLNCCDWALAGNDIVANEGEDLEVNYDNRFLDDTSFYKWSPYSSPRFGTVFGQNGGQWVGFRDISPIMVKDKRSLFGIMGLVTKRPHKTASEIQHLPPQDAFMSVRGRKKRSTVPSISSATEYMSQRVYPIVTNYDRAW